MRGIERSCVITALGHRPPSLVPYHIRLTLPMREKLQAHRGPGDLDDMMGNFLASVVPVPRDAELEIEPGVFKDEFGVAWDRTVDRDIGTPRGQVLPRPSLDGYRFPELRLEERVAHIPAFLEQFGTRYVEASVRFTLYERAWSMRGMESLLMDMVLNPGFVHELMDRICEWTLKVVDKVCDLPIDAVRFGDDWGAQHGLQMGPDLWRAFVKPRFARLCRCVHDHGKKVFLHSCGKVSELFDEMIEIGIDVFNPFQPEVMDIYEVKRRYAGRLAFYGGISVQRLLPYGTPEEVRREVKRAISELGRGGGYILGPSHSVPRDVPLENLIAMIEACKQQ